MKFHAALATVVGLVCLFDESAEATEIATADSTSRGVTWRLASGHADKVTFRVLRPTPEAPAAMHVRTGAVAGSGDLKIQVCNYPDCSATNRLFETSVNFAPNAWNRVDLGAFWNSVPGYERFVVVSRASASTDVELVGARTPVKAARIGTYGDAWAPFQQFFMDSDGYSQRELDDGGWAGLPAGGTPALLLEYAEPDPWALAQCGDAGLTVGNPYFEFEHLLVPVDGGAAQTFVAAALGSGNVYDDYIFRFMSPITGGDSGTSYVFSTSGPGIDNQDRTTDAPFTYPGKYCMYVVPWHRATQHHEFRVRPDAPGLRWMIASAGDNLDPCSAAARSTFSGALGSAQIAGTSHAGKDFVFYTYTGWPFAGMFLDRDRDGFGDPSTPDDCLWPYPSAVGGLSPYRAFGTPRDCDDFNPKAYPDAGELCDGRDTDCDGRADDVDTDVPRPVCERTAAMCSNAVHSAQLCIDGGWAECGRAEYGPWFEAVETNLCDLLDNDCDGNVDDDGWDPCPLSVGVCAGAAPYCELDGGHVACGPAAYGPKYELDEMTCDDFDNDCDGLIDELAEKTCPLTHGVCATSSGYCTTDGGYLACGPARYGPLYEESETRCDGLDNDCDGFSDEGCRAAVLDGGTQRPTNGSCGCGSPSTAPLLFVALLALLRRRHPSFRHIG